MYKYLLLLFYITLYGQEANSQEEKLNDTIFQIDAFLKDKLITQYQLINNYRILNGISFLTSDMSQSVKYNIQNLMLDVRSLNRDICESKIFSARISSYIDKDSIKIKPSNTFFDSLGIQNRLILIGYSQNGIKIISGDLTNSLYSMCFDLDLNKIDTYYQYLELKMFVYNLKDIKYKKKDKKWIYFSAVENIYTIPTIVYLRINRKFPDIVERLGKNISGKYKRTEKTVIY